MKKIKWFMVAGILCVVLSSCANEQNKVNKENTDNITSNNVPVELNCNTSSEVTEFAISDGNDVWEVGGVVKELFNGGGTRDECNEYVLYTYGQRVISTKINDGSEIIRYISTQNNKDYIGRGLSIGDSLEELLEAYGDELILESEWDNDHLPSNSYDKVYKYSNSDESSQIIFSLKEDEIIMIQIASNQELNNTTLKL